MIAVNEQTRPVNIAELSVGEMEEVNGGILFLPLAGAVLATTVQFSFVAGIFAGSHER